MPNRASISDDVRTTLTSNSHIGNQGLDRVTGQWDAVWSEALGNLVFWVQTHMTCRQKQIPVAPTAFWGNQKVLELHSQASSLLLWSHLQANIETQGPPCVICIDTLSFVDRVSEELASSADSLLSVYA
jgi:hypothetical protein